MKKFLFGMISSFLCLTACQDTMVHTPEKESTNYSNCLGLVYPLSQEYQNMTVRTRSEESTFETDWENKNSVTTAIGNTIILPWASISSDANIPNGLALDIKKEDGWQLLFHTFQGIDVGARDRNYMAFHNLRTGVLKVFYYLIDKPQSNNGGAWGISFTVPQKLLNMTSEIADPINIGQNNYWGCTNVVTSKNKGFQQGWNCFMLSLAYNPSNYADCKIDINSHLLNTTDVNLFGENNSYSKGTILTYGSNNPLSGLTGDLATVFGQSAGEWLDNAVKKGDIKTDDAEPSTRSALLAGSAAAIIKFGVNKIFSKLTASFNQPTITKSDLEFTTRGTTNITGDITFNSTSPVLSLRAPFDKDKVGELGVWNLTEMPTVYVNAKADYAPTTDDHLYKEYFYKLRGIYNYEYKVVINPQLKPHIIDYWFDKCLIRYYTAEEAPKIPAYYTDFGTLGGAQKGFSQIFYEDDLLYGKYGEKHAIYEQKLVGTLLVRGLTEPSPVILVPHVSSYESKCFPSNNTFMKITLHLVTEFEGKRDTTISTRTFLPKIEWDPSWL